jgi:hypothetical protein
VTEQHDDDAADPLAVQDVPQREPLTPAARRSRNFRITILVVVPVLSFSLAWWWVASGRRFPSGDDFTGEPGLDVVGFVLIAAGAAMMTVGLVLTIRKGRFKPAWRSPLVNLSRSDRKELIRLIRRGDVPPRGRETVARQMAIQMKRQQQHVIGSGGVVLLTSGNALLERFTVLLWLALGTFVVLVVTGGMMTRDAHLATQWLARHANSE